MKTQAHPLPTITSQFLKSKGKTSQTGQATSTHHNHVNCHTTFPQFALLPLELRQEIWSYLLPGPRLIEVYAERVICPQTHKQVERYSQPHIGQYFAANPHRPVLLRTCSDSRRVALRAFSYCLSIPSLSPGILFQPGIDTIYFRSENQHWLTHTILDSHLPTLKVDNIQSFAFDDWQQDLVHGNRGSPANFFPFLYQGPLPLLSRLQKLYFIRVQPYYHMTDADEVDDKTKWLSWIENALKAVKSPLDLQIQIVRKSHLWGGNGTIPWEETPHWMARWKRECLRKRDAERSDIWIGG